MPQLEQIDTFVSQLIWLTITFVALYFFLRKVVLPGIGDILEERQERVRSDLDKAAQLKKQAEEVREAYEKMLAEGRSEAQKVIRKATDAAAQKAAERQQELATKIAQEITAAEQRIDQARIDALENVRGVAGDIARDVVQRIIDTQVDDKAVDQAIAAGLEENR